MPRQEHKGFSVDVPSDWDDRTVVIYQAPRQGAKVMSANLAVTREKIAPATSLRTYAAKQLGELAKALDGFELLESRDMNAGGFPGVDTTFVWEAPTGPIVQRQLTCIVQDTAYIVTASVPRADENEMKPSLDAIFQSFQFSTPAAQRPVG